ncbi:ABC transporter, ATP-binding protein [Helicobacter pylori Hp A-27]|nr:ABC transporter, ATP-binding protein [Helicobacter pylori Hp A-27]
MDEPETSLEQNALIRLSNLISLRNTQQLTSIIATHDPIVLDSCEWVLFLKEWQHCSIQTFKFYIKICS